MNNGMAYPFALIAGFGLGLAYFAGLWWTVQRLGHTRSPAGLIVLSSLLRMSLLLGGFFVVAGGDLMRLALCLMGWLTARQFSIRRFGPDGMPERKGGGSCT
jgi:F1F0 ATPase subunit 2